MECFRGLEIVLRVFYVLFVFSFEGWYCFYVYFLDGFMGVQRFNDLFTLCGQEGVELGFEFSFLILGFFVASVIILEFSRGVLWMLGDQVGRLSLYLEGIGIFRCGISF